MSYQLFLAAANSFITTRLPCRYHSSACLVMLCGERLRILPMHLYFRNFISSSTVTWLVAGICIYLFGKFSRFTATGMEHQILLNKPNAVIDLLIWLWTSCSVPPFSLTWARSWFVLSVSGDWLWRLLAAVSQFLLEFLQKSVQSDIYHQHSLSLQICCVGLNKCLCILCRRLSLCQGQYWKTMATWYNLTLSQRRLELYH